MLVFEVFNIKTVIFLSFLYLCSHVDFLLISGNLFLLDPAIDGSNLLVETLLQSQKGLIFPLEFSFHNRIHGRISVTHLVPFMFALLAGDFILNVHLILDFIDLAHSLFLLQEKPVYQVCHFHFKLATEFNLDLIHHVFEILVVFKTSNLKSPNVVPFSSEIIFEQIHLLLHLKHLGLDFVDNLRDDGLVTLSFSVREDRALFSAD